MFPDVQKNPDHKQTAAALSASGAARNYIARISSCRPTMTGIPVYHPRLFRREIAERIAEQIP